MDRALMQMLEAQIRRPGTSHARGAGGPMVFVSAGSGLGNRLRAWLGYRALSLCCDVPFQFCWVSNWACATAFHHVFEPPPFPVIGLTELLRSMERRATEAFTHANWCDDIWRDFAADAVSWPRFMDAVRAARREIRFVPRLEAAAARFARAHGLSERIGIHIRHTDNLTKMDEWRRGPSFDLECASSPAGFFREIDRHPAHQKFFVATDNALIARELSERFPHRVCQWPKAFLPLDLNRKKTRPTSVETALIELLLLGHCPAVIGTYFSSFSRMAAILSGRDYSEMWGERRVHDPVIPTRARLLRARIFRQRT